MEPGRYQGKQKRMVFRLAARLGTPKQETLKVFKRTLEMFGMLGTTESQEHFGFSNPFNIKKKYQQHVREYSGLMGNIGINSAVDPNSRLALFFIFH